jgi:dTMP kinase
MRPIPGTSRQKLARSRNSCLSWFVTGIFITFEGTEGGGKSTQVKLLAERLKKMNRVVRVLREPGGTPIGEEIRHTLQHSEANRAMTSEAELLLMNASRAQLVREIIRPALAAGEIVLCDRFYDSTTAYQGHGRQLDLKKVEAIVDFAVEGTRPDLTLLLDVPIAVSEARRTSRQTSQPGAETRRDRIEDADRAFFERVQRGFHAIAAREPKRVRLVDATQSVEAVSTKIWDLVAPLVVAEPRTKTK